MLVSVVIRTLNESLYLAELLQNIKSQKKDVFDVEVVVIDSGSTDGTLKIAHDFGSRITFIDKKILPLGGLLIMVLIMQMERFLYIFPDIVFQQRMIGSRN